MLTKENKSGSKQFLDDIIILSGMYEILSDIGISIGVNTFDVKVLEKINPVYHNVINEILSHVFAKEYAEAKQKLAILLANVITTPFIDGTAEENAMYLQILNAIHAIIENLLAKQNEA